MASCTNVRQFPSIFRECPLQVIVGSEKTLYYIHPGVLSSCGSPALKARIDGPRKTNGASGIIDWTDFDEDTIECALSYLYVEDYSVCGRKDVGEQTEEENDGDRIGRKYLPSTGTNSSVSGSIMSDEAPLERPPTPLSRCLQVGLSAEAMETAAAAFAKEFHGCDERLGDMALMHAKVYCFAHQYLISKLENLALQRLTQLLLVCDILTSPFFLRLADAIRLVYDSTPKMKLNDPARELLSQYVALKYTTLSEDCLDTLIAEGGDFMVDVSHKLGRRISMSRTSARSLEGHVEDLEMTIKKLEQEAQNQARLLNRAEEEIQKWESWNRGKLMKARRIVAPFQFSAVRESLA